VSKITNDGLMQSRRWCFICVLLHPYGNSGHQRVKTGVCSGSRWQWMNYRTCTCASLLFVSVIICQ